MFWDDEQLPEVPADILDQLEGRGFDMGDISDRERSALQRVMGLYAGIPEISVSPAPVPPRAHPGR
ncbi:hypothetical protein CBL13_05767 [Pseudomonas putida]|nr:hypothetical protein CBL13_05767 [Pseudomonas putida]